MHAPGCMVVCWDDPAWACSAWQAHCCSAGRHANWSNMFKTQLVKRCEFEIQTGL